MAAIQTRLTFENKIFAGEFIETIAVFLVDLSDDFAFGNEAWLIHCHSLFVDAYGISGKIGIHGRRGFQIRNIEG